MSGMSKPVQFGTAIVLGVLLVGAVAAGLIYGDDIHELWESKDQATTERVQLQGLWMGMRLSPATEPSELGPPSTAGVRVTEISERYGWRARMAGLAPGDIITSVSGKKVNALTDLDTVSQKLNASTAIQLDILRWGQPFAVSLPALSGVPAVAGAPPMGAPGIMPPSLPPGLMPPGQPLGGYAPPTAGGFPAAPAATPATFYCARDRQMFSQPQVHPHYRCPVCAGPLTTGQ